MNRFFAKYFFYYPVTLLNGEIILRHLKTGDAFQRQPIESIKLNQTKALNNLIAYVKEHSPYYKKLLIDVNDANEFTDIPFLTKQLLINEFNNICTPRAKDASLKTTGGSTGEPVKIYKNSDALARERAATWRSYEWAKVGIGDKQARFWGVPHNSRNALKAKIIDFISNRKRVSAFNLTKESLDEYYDIMVKFKPSYLYGYVSVIRRFSEHIREYNLPMIQSVRSIITTSEVLTDGDRKTIEDVWNVKVFNEYGCGEVGSIAHECEHGNMHIVADNMLIEIIDQNGNPAETGEVVVTDFYNYATPMIRYKVGDFATLSHEACPCGRTLPVLKGIHGRAYDLIKTTSGKSIHPEALIYVFEELQSKTAAFSQFQIVQTEIDKLSIYIIKSSNWHDDIMSDIESDIHKNIDASFQCHFVFCDTLEREKSGKMRVVKSLVSNNN
jgi:phenylacetate-CoA ligase